MVGSLNAQPPLPEPPRMNLARVQALPWLLFIAMLGLAAWLGMKAFGADDIGDPVDAERLRKTEQAHRFQRRSWPRWSPQRTAGSSASSIRGRSR